MIVQKYLDLINYIPEVMIPSESKNNGTGYPTDVTELDFNYSVSYKVKVSNQYGDGVGRREIVESLPKQILRDKQFFEVMGLLQGESLKGNHHTYRFVNNRPELINLVMKWFKDQLDIGYEEWLWDITINLKIQDDELKEILQEELTETWLANSPIKYEKRKPKTLHFKNPTNNEIARNDGSLMIQRSGQVFVKTVRRLVNEMTFLMPQQQIEEIIPYMRGIIAAEGCINFRLESGHRRVFITAVKDDERKIFMQCLDKLDIEYTECKPIKDIVISRRENIQKLQDLDLMSLNKEKHRKFLKMINSYQ